MKTQITLCNLCLTLICLYGPHYIYADTTLLNNPPNTTLEYRDKLENITERYTKESTNKLITIKQKLSVGQSYTASYNLSTINTTKLLFVTKPQLLLQNVLNMEINPAQGLLYNITQFDNNSSYTAHKHKKDLDNDINHMFLFHGYYKLVKHIVKNNMTRLESALKFRRQRRNDEKMPETDGERPAWASGMGGPPVGRPPGGKMDSAQGAANRFTNKASTTVARRTMTRPYRLTFEDPCTNAKYYCMAAHQTGRVCGRTLYYMYQDFRTYCDLDYVNCREKYEVWHPIHMGWCYTRPFQTRWGDFNWYEYNDDSFLSQYLVPNENAYDD